MIFSASTLLQRMAGTKQEFGGSARLWKKLHEGKSEVFPDLFSLGDSRRIRRRLILDNDN